ncbi:thiamine-phosphate kinase [Ornithinibacillus halophilus]|uniref:Thiamine-monophosphate kinase n=1 Tax=Ornithinibacillus halophilus TaxID=930117 RepID=A0A1M5HGY9_9BACI|nr:thiamine-phosphate kinase [Ornithinibacillus halophilus]SHG15102.1 thiamine-phosphate kinase [Ornithinibacillus halophilus]
MDEFQFIKHIEQNFYRQSTIRKGTGDDAAVFTQNYQETVVAKDMLVENVHFSRKTMEPFHIGYKGLAANISDLAAMGASPAFYLVGISIPPNWSIKEIEDIYNGFKAISNHYGMDLIGGDTVSGNELVLSVTVIGFVNKNRIRYRHLAKDGDVVFVTGHLGDSQAGLHLLTSATSMERFNDVDYFIHRHRMPTPRVKFSKAIETIPRVSLNDISDGLASEANEIAEASQVDIIIFDKKIPSHPSYNQFPLNDQKKWKYFGGEDFELLGTVSPSDWSKLEEAARISDTRLSKIGYVSDKKDRSGRVYLERTGQSRIQLKKEGYNHLSR